MHWMHVVLVTSLSGVYSKEFIHFPDGTINVHYWDVKPFIWRDEENVTKGLLVDIMKEGELFCINKTSSKDPLRYHEHSHETFQTFLKNIKLLSMKKSELQSILLGPIIGFPRHQKVAPGVTLSPYQLYDSQGFVIMLHEEKVLLFNKLWVAMWKCSSIIAIMACFSVWVGVLIWVMVSAIKR